MNGTVRQIAYINLYRLSLVYNQLRTVINVKQCQPFSCDSGPPGSPSQRSIITKKRSPWWCI